MVVKSRIVIRPSCDTQCSLEKMGIQPNDINDTVQRNKYIQTQALVALSKIFEQAVKHE